MNTHRRLWNSTCLNHFVFLHYSYASIITTTNTCSFIWTCHRRGGVIDNIWSSVTVPTVYVMEVSFNMWIISIIDLTLFFPQNVVIPVWMEKDVSTIIPASVLHTGLENTVKKVCYILPILTHIQQLEHEEDGLQKEVSEQISLWHITEAAIYSLYLKLMHSYITVTHMYK